MVLVFGHAMDAHIACIAQQSLLALRARQSGGAPTIVSAIGRQKDALMRRKQYDRGVVLVSITHTAKHMYKLALGAFKKCWLATIKGARSHRPDIHQKK